MGTRNTRVVTSALLAFGGWGVGLGSGWGMILRCPYSLGEAQRCRCFTPIFGEAVLSLRSRRPISAKGLPQ